jgi:hypothetical protein
VLRHSLLLATSYIAIFHAAGVLDDGPLMLKAAESATRVLAPKVRGTLALEAALKDTPLSCFVLFSSISSIVPPAGQVDYAAANAFLDAFALSRKGPVTAINWGAWREVGMAARTASQHPWLEKLLLDTPDAIVYSGEFSQQSRWVLSEHRFKNGIALIPGTGYLEMAASAFMHGSLEGAVEFQDVFFLAPFMVDASESRKLRVQLKREQEADKGTFRFSIFSNTSSAEFPNSGTVETGKWVEHSTGTIAPCRSLPAAQVDLTTIAARLDVSLFQRPERKGAVLLFSSVQIFQLRLLVSGKRLRRKLQDFFCTSVRLGIHTNFGALGDEANHQPNGVGQVEAQAAIRVCAGLAMRVHGKLPGFRRQRIVVGKRDTHQRAGGKRFAAVAAEPEPFGARTFLFAEQSGTGLRDLLTEQIVEVCAP